MQAKVCDVVEEQAVFEPVVVLNLVSLRTDQQVN